LAEPFLPQEEKDEADDDDDDSFIHSFAQAQK